MKVLKKQKKKMNTHGGARKGAGRKPLGRTPYRIRMQPETMAVMRKRATCNGYPHVGVMLDNDYKKGKI